jgi:hypothetical protein
MSRGKALSSTPRMKQAERRTCRIRPAVPRCRNRTCVHQDCRAGERSIASPGWPRLFPSRPGRSRSRRRARACRRAQRLMANFSAVALMIAPRCSCRRPSRPPRTFCLARHSRIARSLAAAPRFLGGAACGLNKSRAGNDSAEGKKRQLIASTRQMFVSARASAAPDGEVRARDQFGMPIMQSLKRCTWRWPMWPRPSPSRSSLPTNS